MHRGRFGYKFALHRLTVNNVGYFLKHKWSVILRRVTDKYQRCVGCNGDVLTMSWGCLCNGIVPCGEHNYKRFRFYVVHTIPCRCQMQIMDKAEITFVMWCITG